MAPQQLAPQRRSPRKRVKQETEDYNNTILPPQQIVPSTAAGSVVAAVTPDAGVDFHGSRYDNNGKRRCRSEEEEQLLCPIEVKSETNFPSTTHSTTVVSMDITTKEYLPTCRRILKTGNKKQKLSAATRPTYKECQFVVEELGKLHPDVIEECKLRKQEGGTQTQNNKSQITDGIVSTILSQNTTNANSTRAFQKLKKVFPTWEKVIALPDPPTKLENAIRCGGLAKIKASRIYTIMKTITNERGNPCFEYLRELSNEQVKKELIRFPGLGPKTISCVLLFTM